MRPPTVAIVLCLLLSTWSPSVTAAVAPAETSYPPPEAVRAAFLKQLDRPKIPLDAETISTSPDGPGLVAERLRFAVETRADGGREWVTALVIRPETTDVRRPAVVVLHGTGGSKDGERERTFLVELARRGILGIAIDARYHGDRSGGAPKSEAYTAAIVRAWRARPGERQEHPWFFDTCWDIWRTLDYLETRADVDASRLGMVGFSMGGIETWLAGAADPRVKVAVPAISVQSFRWTLENDRWQGRAGSVKLVHDAVAADLKKKEVDREVCRALWTKVTPGILDPFDGPSMMRLFAPDRPVLVLSSDNDPNCPIEGMRLAVAAAEKAYGPEAAKERLHVDLARGVGHRVTDEQRQHALQWFETWLQPSRPPNDDARGDALVESFRRTEQALMDAVAVGDTAVWERVMDPACVIVSEEGQVMDKRQFLAELRPLPAGLSGRITVKDVAVREFPSLAVVSYLADEEESVFGQTIGVKYRVSNTYRKDGAGWKMVASLITVVTQDPPAQPVSKKSWPGFVGAYRLLPDGWTFTVELRDGQLYGGRDPQKLRPLVPLTPDAFVLQGSLGEWLFVTENGKATRILNLRKFAPLVWTRVDTPAR